MVEIGGQEGQFTHQSFYEFGTGAVLAAYLQHQSLVQMREMSSLISEDLIYDIRAVDPELSPDEMVLPYFPELARDLSWVEVIGNLDGSQIRIVVNYGDNTYDPQTGRTYHKPQGIVLSLGYAEYNTPSDATWHDNSRRGQNAVSHNVDAGNWVPTSGEYVFNRDDEQLDSSTREMIQAAAAVLDHRELIDKMSWREASPNSNNDDNDGGGWRRVFDPFVRRQLVRETARTKRR